VKFAGIDVGLRNSTMAVISGGKAEIYRDYRTGISERIVAAGIDAPLSFPERGFFRECERRLLERGIKLFPSGSPFFKRVVERGIEIAYEFEKIGIQVFEVYPFATRVLLDIAPDCNKRKKSCLNDIKKELENYVTAEINTHDEADAVISALTVKMFFEGQGELVSGKDGSILIPKK